MFDELQKAGNRALKSVSWSTMKCAFFPSHYYIFIFLLFHCGGHSATLGLCTLMLWSAELWYLNWRESILEKIILFTQWGWTIFNGCTSITWGRFSGKGLSGNTLHPMWLGVIYGSHTLSGIRGWLCHPRWSAWKVSQLKRRAVMVHSFRGGWTRFDSLFEREWKFWFSSKGLIVWVALRCTATYCSTHFINIRYDVLWFSWACRV